ncbi:IclR family transcriptional regulator [Halomonas dongshanensis]|uniref:IclR family transcriptional regulator n=1 Tax=Halomonas dongshanensis TaxID=2890835 RepID=A0ABT2EHP1_9GAMM|nr:IclR family transcriptional regulator [Halomonas dongshanensis]MCS2611128.1 IclR family transcriptional regulator [Halomonas dongshanensis]
MAYLSGKENDYTVPALQRGLRIIELFDQRRRVLTTQEFADALGVTTSSIYRIVTTLTEMRYLDKVAKNTYQLGPQVISNGFNYLASRDIVEIAMPHLSELRDSVSMSCHLSVREGREAVYVHRAFASQRLSVNVPIGTRIACHSCAMGRVLLTDLSERQLDALYRDVRLDDYPPPAPRTLPELKSVIAADRRNGKVVHRSDYATAIATGLSNYRGQVVAAINVSGPDTLMGDERYRQGLTAQLTRTAEKISFELGKAQSA